MLNISYTISPKLREYLDRIESLRKQILLTPVSPALELKMRWEAIFNRTYYTLKLSGNPLTQNEMLKVLAEIVHKKMSYSQQQVIKYKKAQDYISQNWLGSPSQVSAHALIDLHKIIGNGKLRIPQAGLQYLLDYLQAHPEPAERARSENPIIQAAIVNIQIEKMQLFSEHILQISCLSSLLFLYKYGYDFRGFLANEKEWAQEGNPLAGGYKEIRKQALNSASLTLWLEYFAGCTVKTIELIARSIEKPRSEILGLRESFWRLNERQKSILSYLDQPKNTITNRQIQKRHNISQITASRDLSKLTNLGLLFSHGKGRSVYYTRI